MLHLALVIIRAAKREGFGVHYWSETPLERFGAPMTIHARIGTPQDRSFKIPKGKAQAAIGLNRADSIRLGPYLSAEGTAVLSSQAVLHGEARQNKSLYPSKEKVEENFNGGNIIWTPAVELAALHGPPCLASSAMLGAFAGTNQVVERENLIICLREETPSLADEAVEAFFEGYSFVAGGEN